ncbi:nitric oxide synthase oxygenase [Streptomyces sp. A7024]|uniref:Nitric oxide synthase oxygenase n=1 Tax=Streptomyces coryli TaxID=1128680 RepID=A0A6G4TVL6_9ACTN|nr:nitric oxide synthase oxygenase [Streptomyces coryli]
MQPTTAVRPADAELTEQAEDFLLQYAAEEEAAAGPGDRLAAIRAEIAATGTYTHTAAELAYGARLAWRNSNRCIGRLYWRSLRVRDRRHVNEPARVALECAAHLREATNGGRIRPLITVFAPDRPGRPGPRIRNEQLIRYAGYGPGHGDPSPSSRLRSSRGDPMNAGITATALALGWQGGAGTDFDVLPLVIESPPRLPRCYELPPDAVLEVSITHPDLPDFPALRWHAVPAISSMCLEIGGLCYPAAPFNGWYMGTEIGARNLADADRYNLLPVIAAHLGLDTTTHRSLWKDRALVELNRAVLHSFDRAGVTITDHHTESERFLAHIEREARRGRATSADWSWIVPPLSGSATPVFHRYYDTTERTPAYVHHRQG